MKKKRILNILMMGLISLGLLELLGHWMAWRASKKNPFPYVKTIKQDRSLRNENALWRKKIEALQPKELFIVVDTANNTLLLYQGQQLILRAIVSCGSGAILVDPSGKRRWIFETPRGEFVIQSKHENPVWVKPDWAFVEEGKPIPKNVMERLEEGMLGSYALGFGNGYFIHGTLYSRLLGKNITHGCIRVGDQELKKLYELVPLGTKVLIF
jgi:L,D-transpeptidase YbiS